MLGAGTYKGNPVTAHQNVNRKMLKKLNRGMEQADFQAWLALFVATIDELFSGENAEHAKRGAERMAGHLAVVCAADYQQPPLNLVPERYVR